MGSFLLVMFAAVVGLLLQTTVFHLLPLGPAIPDTILILCVYLALHQHNAIGALGAFLLGYFTDNFSGNVIGLHAFAMTLVFVLVYLLARRLWMDNLVSNVAVVFVAALLKAMAIALLLGLYLSADYPWRQLVATSWLEAAAAAVLAPVVFSLLDSGRKLWALD